MAGWLGARLSRTAISAGLIVAGILVSGVFVFVFALTGPAPDAGLIAIVVLSEAGYAAVALAFLVATGRGLAYIDLPSSVGRHTLYGLAGAVALLVCQRVVLVALEFAGVVTTTGVGLERFPVEVADAVRTVLPVLVVLSVLVIGPAEELLFRNVIQKYLGEAFSTWGAIAVASALFALTHAPNYVTVPSAMPLSVGLGVTFVISVLLGWLYVRTGTILAPIVAHGVYDAVLFGSAYLRLVGLAPFG